MPAPFLCRTLAACGRSHCAALLWLVAARASRAGWEERTALLDSGLSAALAFAASSEPALSPHSFSGSGASGAPPAPTKRSAREHGGCSGGAEPLELARRVADAAAQIVAGIPGPIGAAARMSARRLWRRLLLYVLRAGTQLVRNPLAEPFFLTAPPGPLDEADDAAVADRLGDVEAALGDEVMRERLAAVREAIDDVLGRADRAIAQVRAACAESADAATRVRQDPDREEVGRRLGVVLSLKCAVCSAVVDCAAGAGDADADDAANRRATHLFPACGHVFHARCYRRLRAEILEAAGDDAPSGGMPRECVLCGEIAALQIGLPIASADAMPD